MPRPAFGARSDWSRLHRLVLLGRRAGLENGVADEITSCIAHCARYRTTQLVLRGQYRVATRTEATSGLDHEEIAQRILMRGERGATFLDQSLRACKHTSRREELDRHVGQSLELLLSLDDLRSIMLNDALRRRV